MEGGRAFSNDSSGAGGSLLFVCDRRYIFALIIAIFAHNCPSVTEARLLLDSSTPGKCSCLWLFTVTRHRYRREPGRDRAMASAKFLSVGTHRPSTVSCSARVRAANRRQCRSNGQLEDRPFRSAPIAAVESDCSTKRQRRVCGERSAQRTASTVTPSSLSLICFFRAGPRNRRRTATRHAAGSEGASNPALQAF